MWYYYSHVRMAQIRWAVIQSVDKDMEELELPYTLDGNLNGKTTLQSDLVVS